MSDARTKTKGKVLLFSGGLDSYIAAKLWEPDVLLYCAIGHRYQQKELEAIERTGLSVRVDHRLQLGDLERDDAIIPLRNLYLIAIASHYGQRIGIGALKGEVNPDKSPKFRRQTEKVLQTCYAASYWSAGTKHAIEYPVGKFSKAGLIREFIKRGNHWSELTTRTRSCYSTTKLPCGHCSACVKRYIAMQLNGITESYERTPQTSPYLATIKARMKTFSADRRAEVRAVFPEL